MNCRLLVPALVLLASCGGGPSSDQFSGLWQLESVNSQPLAAIGTTTGSALWVVLFFR